jgi:RNA-binding protein
MNKLKGFQKKFLKGLAHDLPSIVQIGKNGLSPSLFKEINDQLENHELIKVKFKDFKDSKKDLSKEIETETKSQIVGMIGHVAIFYKQNKIEEKRKIIFPERSGE